MLAGSPGDLAVDDVVLASVTQFGEGHRHGWESLVRQLTRHVAGAEPGRGLAVPGHLRRDGGRTRRVRAVVADDELQGDARVGIDRSEARRTLDLPRMIAGMARRFARVAAAIVVLAMAACSESKTPSTTSSSQAATSGSPAAARSSASPTPSPVSSPTRHGPETERELRQFLLTSDDLGPMWHLDSADAPGKQRTNNAACSAVERGLYTKGSARLVVTAGWAFDGAAQTEQVDHIVKAHPWAGGSRG